jgi:hypothetical protein
MTAGQMAATKRTILLLFREGWFKAQLSLEIQRAEARASRTGIPAVFRLNGTSDLDWTDIISTHPDSQFYDYSKLLGRVRKGSELPNYTVVYSGSMYSQQSRRSLERALERRYPVAMAVNTKGLASDSPALNDLIASSSDTGYFRNYDATDLRHLDAAPGTIGLLKRKGSSKLDRAAENQLSASFFITRENMGAFEAIVNAA